MILLKPDFDTFQGKALARQISSFHCVLTEQLNSKYYSGGGKKSCQIHHKRGLFLTCTNWNS